MMIRSTKPCRITKQNLQSLRRNLNSRQDWMIICASNNRPRFKKRKKNKQLLIKGKDILTNVFFCLNPIKITQTKKQSYPKTAYTYCTAIGLVLDCYWTGTRLIKPI